METECLERGPGGGMETECLERGPGRRDGAEKSPRANSLFRGPAHNTLG